VYQRTGIPFGKVPSSDQQALRSTITSNSLSDARKTVSSIRQAYECQVYTTNYAYWLAHKPKPVTTTKVVDGKKTTTTTTPAYVPAPKAPSGGCPPQGASG
jgi:hypothetical protein